METQRRDSARLLCKINSAAEANQIQNERRDPRVRVALASHGGPNKLAQSGFLIWHPHNNGPMKVERVRKLRGSFNK